VLNPKAKNYALLKRTFEQDYEDNHWAEDSIFLERNSRDFVSRIDRINTNAEAICDVLSSHPRGASSYLPSSTPSPSDPYPYPPALSCLALHCLDLIRLTHSRSKTSKLPQNIALPPLLRQMPQSHRRLRRSPLRHIPHPRRRHRLLRRPGYRQRTQSRHKFYA